MRWNAALPILALIWLALVVGLELVEPTPTHARPHITAADRARILVIAHRGASSVAPENTIPAMLAATKAHTNMVEFDVQRTSDGHLIVVHDSTFARTTNVARAFPRRVFDPVGSFTLGQVRRLDAGSWMAPRFTGTRVPTLRRLLAVMRPTRTNLLLELKNPDLYPGYEAQVARALRRTGYIRAHRVYVHSFSISALMLLHKDAPTVPLGLLTHQGISAATGRSGLRTVNPTANTVTGAGVDHARAEHLQVFAWPAHGLQVTEAQVDHLVEDGVTGIITNNPAAIRRDILEGS
ncbi:MAG TPA: glycerophosphodiester phosphodiesterase family protein [Nocardioidaceae bacterium]|nr:glycerophosphodiester phosphodiesterase family protein [Nocardioidaceae bacterium]